MLGNVPSLGTTQTLTHSQRSQPPGVVSPEVPSYRKNSVKRRKYSHKILYQVGVKWLSQYHTPRLVFLKRCRVCVCVCVCVFFNQLWVSSLRGKMYKCLVLSEVGQRPVGDLSISGGVCIKSLCQRPVNIDPSRSTSVPYDFFVCFRFIVLFFYP